MYCDVKDTELAPGPCRDHSYKSTHCIFFNDMTSWELVLACVPPPLFIFIIFFVIPAKALLPVPWSFSSSSWCHPTWTATPHAKTYPFERQECWWRSAEHDARTRHPPLWQRGGPISAHVQKWLWHCFFFSWRNLKKILNLKKINCRWTTSCSLFFTFTYSIILHYYWWLCNRWTNTSNQHLLCEFPIQARSISRVM